MARSTASASDKAAKAQAAAVKERADEQEALLEENTKAREEEVKELEKERSDDEKHTVTGGVREPVSPTPSYVTAEVGGIERIVAPVRQAWSPAPVKADPAARLEAQRRAERAAEAKDARTKRL